MSLTAAGRPATMPLLRRHLAAAQHAVCSLVPHLDRIEDIGDVIADALGADGRLLAAGNGGARRTQHLTSELVGRFRTDRRPYSAIALHADPSAVTALVNDYGADEVFARQIVAHGRRGDVVVLFSTSGRSPNLLRAAEVTEDLGTRAIAVTGPAPNPLAGLCGHAIAVDVADTAAIQEAHQVVVHLLCVAIESSLGVAT